MKIAILYVVNVLVWGMTWLAIKNQLGAVSPMVSVVYRFGSAALLLLAYCVVRRVNLRFSLQEHLWMALLGITLFSINYWLIYVAEQYIASGLMAIVFSSIVFMNLLNSALFFKTPIKRKMAGGAIVGVFGICIIFLPEIRALDFSDQTILGIIIGLGSVGVASMGNMISARNSRNHLPIIQSTAFGMAYGSMFLSLVAWVTGQSFNYSPTLSYTVSLAYLSVFGSIIGFGCYLSLIRDIGPDRAAYAIMAVPVVALIVSWLAEGYDWSVLSLLGLVLVVLGSFLALGGHNRTFPRIRKSS